MKGVFYLLLKTAAWLDVQSVADPVSKPGENRWARQRCKRSSYRYRHASPDRRTEAKTTPCRRSAHRETKKAIRKAFENQKEKRGLSIVEVLSTCPTNWGMTPLEAIKRLQDECIPYYPLGIYKDVTAEGGEK